MQEKELGLIATLLKSVEFLNTGCEIFDEEIWIFIGLV